MDRSEKIDTAVRWLRAADGILVTAGAGMGVDSGLPDFRGTEGFWRAYPALEQAGLKFQTIANPKYFVQHPRLVWGFYGHRINLYRATEPHQGFHILQSWARGKPQGAFVYTSNVDGHFQKAGFLDGRMMECHGSLLYLQCTRTCTGRIWPLGDSVFDVDEQHSLLLNDLPRCPSCGAVARPNVLLFNDEKWVSDRAADQIQLLRAWLRSVENHVVIELGAGTALPTVRLASERNGAGRVIRINPSDARIETKDGIGFEARALELLALLDARLGGS